VSLSAASYLVRIVVGLAGLLLIFSAGFLYQDEEGKVENRLEVWWEQLRAARVKALSAHTLFLRSTTQTVSRWLSSLYGSSLISTRALSVNTSIMLASGWGFEGASYVYRYTSSLESSPLSASIYTLLFLGCAVLAALLVAVALVRLQFRDRTLVALAIVALVISWSGFVGPLVLLAIPVDLVAVTIMRLLIRSAASQDSPLILFFLFAGATVFPGTVVGALIAQTYAPDEEYYIVYFMWAMVVAPSLVPSASLLLLQITLLFHKLLWPFILRPLYSVKRHRLLFEHRKALIAIGAYLTLSALSPATVSPSAVLRAILKQVGVDAPSK